MIFITTTIFYLDHINGVPSLTFEHTWLGCNTSLHSLTGSHALISEDHRLLKQRGINFCRQSTEQKPEDLSPTGFPAPPSSQLSLDKSRCPHLLPCMLLGRSWL